LQAAAKKFEEVERQHPYSDWARKALVMTAYASYSARDYDEAVSAARRYVTLHPGSPDAAYAQFLIGSSYFDQIPDVTRDQSRTEKAIAALEEVSRKFPESEYSTNAKRKIDIARDQLAGKEMTVGRYYMDKKDFIGAINRFKIVVTQYQTTRHVEEALLRLIEAIWRSACQRGADRAAVLGHNFPDSRWYADAYRLVKRVAGAGRKQALDQPAFKKRCWLNRHIHGSPDLPCLHLRSCRGKLQQDPVFFEFHIRRRLGYWIICIHE
jgi:outer membrane protein assembly factor BamD